MSRWKEIQRVSPSLHRAFFSPAFSLACEAAGFDVRVAVIRQDDLIQAFFPYQYRSCCHRLVGLGEPVGGHLSDASGIIAMPGWRISAAELMRMCRLGAIHINCLADGQAEFGLDAYQEIPNYIVDLSEGYERYMKGLQSRNADFVRDTGRRFRRATRSLGSMNIKNSGVVTTEALERLVLQKRSQYKRTNTDDALNDVRTFGVLKYLALQKEQDCKVFHTTLEADEKVIAEHFGLQYFGVLSYWFPVYNPDYQQYSPGRLMLWDIIKEAPQSGVTMIDFGEGEAQYKRQFSTKSITAHKAYWDAGEVRSGFAKAYQSFYWRAELLSQRLRIKFSSMMGP